MAGVPERASCAFASLLGAPVEEEENIPQTVNHPMKGE